MNALTLQNAIVSDLKDLFKDRRYSSPTGTAIVSVLPQNLPKRESEDDDDPFPYIIVRLDAGKIESQTDAYTVDVLLLIGAYSDDASNQGHQSVLEIMETIQRHYEEKPRLAEQFVFTDPFHWALQDEESYPYFFGAVSMSFNLPAPRREWSELV